MDMTQKEQVRFKVDKCKIVHTGGIRNIKAFFIMSTTTFDETVEEKDLEIWTDNPMKLSFMCLYAAYKANQLLVLYKDYSHIWTVTW